MGRIAATWVSGTSSESPELIIAELERAMSRVRPIFPVALSMEQCGKSLSVPTRIVRDAVERGELSAWRAPSGGRIRVLVRDLENHVRTHWPRAAIRRHLKKAKRHE